MRKIKYFALLLFIASLAVTACKKTVESESANFERNVQNSNTYAAKYPNLADLLKQESEQAKKAFEESKSISDEKAKIDKMSQANNIFYNGISGKLSRFESDIESLKRSINSLKGKSIETTDDMKGLRLDMNLNQIQSEINQMPAKIMNMKPENTTAAIAVLDGVLSDIRNYSDQIHKLEDIVNKQNKSNQDSSSSNNTNNNTQNGGGGQDNSPKVEMVKCQYCNKTFDKIANKTCPGCGAAPK